MAVTLGDASAPRRRIERKAPRLERAKRARGQLLRTRRGTFGGVFNQGLHATSARGSEPRTYLDATSDARTATKFASHSAAMTLARNDFPQPVGPCKSTPARALRSVAARGDASAVHTQDKALTDLRPSRRKASVRVAGAAVGISRRRGDCSSATDTIGNSTSERSRATTCSYLAVGHAERS